MNTVRAVCVEVGLSKEGMLRAMGKVRGRQSLLAAPDSRLSKEAKEKALEILEAYRSFVARILVWAGPVDTRLISAEDIARVTGLSLVNITALRSRGKLEGRKVGGTYWYTVGALERLIRTRHTAPLLARNPVSSAFLKAYLAAKGGG